MNDLEQKFSDTVDYIKNTEGHFKPSNDLKLEMYALFKQATEGDVSGAKPGMMDLVGKAKYAAWKKVKGTSSEEAMQAYINNVESLKS
jgi:acyl-CoA-binding protein